MLSKTGYNPNTRQYHTELKKRSSHQEDKISKAAISLAIQDDHAKNPIHVSLPTNLNSEVLERIRVLIEKFMPEFTQEFEENLKSKSNDQIVPLLHRALENHVAKDSIIKTLRSENDTLTEMVKSEQDKVSLLNDRENTFKTHFIVLTSHIKQLLSPGQNQELPKELNQSIECATQKIQEIFDINDDTQFNDFDFLETFSATNESDPHMEMFFENPKIEGLLNKIYELGKHIDVLRGSLQTKLAKWEHCHEKSTLEEELKIFSEKISEHVTNLKGIKKELDEHLLPLQSFIENGRIKKIPDQEILQTISKISPKSTLTGEAINQYNKNHKQAISEILEILTKFVQNQLNCFLTIRTMTIAILQERSNIIDEIKNTMIATQQNLQLLSINFEKITIPEIRQPILTYLFSTIHDDINHFQANAREYRKSIQNNKISKTELSQLQKKLNCERAELAQIGLIWNWIEPHLEAFITNMQDEIHKEKIEEIPASHLKNMALVQQIDINQLQQRVQEYKEAYKTKETFFNSLISKKDLFSKAVINSRIELHRLFGAIKSNGIFTSETVYNSTHWILGSIMGVHEDPEVSKLFPKI